MPVQAAPSARTAPPFVATLLAAAVASVPVLLMDRLQSLAPRLGLPEGVEAFLVPVGAFVLAWVLALAALLWSPHPAREGLAAGALVVLVMAWIPWTVASDHQPLAFQLLVPFGALAVGLGAGMGALAAGLRRRRRVGIGAAGAWGVAGGLLFALLFPSPPLLPEGSPGPILAAILGVTGLLVGTGLWALLRARRDAREPPDAVA